MSVPSISGQDFVKLVQDKKQPFLVDFWAPWCGPCRMTGPVVEQFAQKHGDKVGVYKLNVDENQALAGQLGIMSIPTLLAIKGGKIAHTIIGYQPLNALEKQLQSWLGN